MGKKEKDDFDKSLQTGDPAAAETLPPEPVTEEEIIFKAVASLRNRSKKLSHGGRERLFAMVRGYIG